MANQSDKKIFLFRNGNYYKAYEYFGSHKAADKNGRAYTVFRTWASDADAVFVTGDFNGWSESCPMKRVTDNGVWEAKIRLDFKNKDKLKYKYLIMRGGRAIFKADPYGFYTETQTETSTYLYELPDFAWTDGGWMNTRKRLYSLSDTEPAYSVPINIYEVHPGSFMRQSGGAYLSFRELADRLGPYVKRMGYTHIELMPVMEHTSDDGTGYEICGFYAPASRFGTPEDFMYFVNKLHSYGIGVLLDFVPSYFSTDEHGLIEFDGGRCYENQGNDSRGEGKVRFFDVGRGEVQSFLISNALYWLDVYHVDGLHASDISSLLYSGKDGTGKNYDAVEFFKKLNSAVLEKYGDVIMTAEETKPYPMVTKPVYLGGLGFDFLHSAKFKNDMMKYIQTPPEKRAKTHKAVTTALEDSFTENYILAVSHNESMPGKKSLYEKNYGDDGQKFAGLRCFLTYMICRPGKKLLFMGDEYGQKKEWDCAAGLDWSELSNEKNAETLRFTSTLNHFYLDTPPLWERDMSWEGFKWVKENDADKNAAVFLRYGADSDFVLCAFNFSDSTLQNYKIGVPEAGLYREVFSTYQSGSLPTPAKRGECDGYSYSISVTLPPFSAVIYKCENLKPFK